ncbi:hypothetical protein R7J20_16740 [Acinetobacter baumannii]|nr:hypothetical protein [Acinetobacter baumannii]MDW5349540.1 hypothetical protein [Acinetobacter baumannii]MDW5367034.1 hypothetical protein [Acinetobacter baumannii]MDW5382301.1 hypothetical protein [Acinetobacter baumannii]
MPVYANLNFPVGTFRVNTLKIKKVGTRFVGKDRINSVVRFLNSSDCIKIMEACGFHHMRIWGTGVFVHDVLVLDEKEHNRADVDVDFNDCYLCESQYLVRVYGRGVIFDNCNVFNIRYAWLDLNFPPENVFERGPENNMNAAQGMRGYIFRNNRNHYSPCYLVKNFGWNEANARGFLFTGNQLEGGSRLINGAAREVVISGNVSYHRTADWKYIEATTLQDVVITGNQFYQHEDPEYPTVPDSGEFITAITLVKNLTITNNHFKRIGKNIARIYTDANTTNTGITIKDNKYEKCFLSGSNLLHLQSGKFDQVVVEEVLTAPNSTWIPVYRNSGLAVTNHKIKVDAIGSPYVHNLPRPVSLGSNKKQGVYVGTGDTLTQNILVGYEARMIRVNGSDGTLALLPYGTSSMANGLSIGTAQDFTVTGNSNKLNIIYCWEAD